MAHVVDSEETVNDALRHGDVCTPIWESDHPPIVSDSDFFEMRTDKLRKLVRVCINPAGHGSVKFVPHVGFCMFGSVVDICFVKGTDIDSFFDKVTDIIDNGREHVCGLDGRIGFTKINAVLPARDSGMKMSFRLNAFKQKWVKKADYGSVFDLSMRQYMYVVMTKDSNPILCGTLNNTDEDSFSIDSSDVRISISGDGAVYAPVLNGNVIYGAITFS